MCEIWQRVWLRLGARVTFKAPLPSLSLVVDPLAASLRTTNYHSNY
jgi:hypothetical protein